MLPYQFHEERGAGGEYIPLRNRRPSVRYALWRVVVEDSVSLVFSEGHFPTMDCADPASAPHLPTSSAEARLNQVMTEAAIRGSVGSVAILLRVLRGRVFVQCARYDLSDADVVADAPDTLASVTERYKVAGSILSRPGYEISPTRRRVTGSCAAGNARAKPGSCLRLSGAG